MAHNRTYRPNSFGGTSHNGVFVLYSSKLGRIVIDDKELIVSIVITVTIIRK